MNKKLIAMAAALLPMIGMAQTNTKSLHISQMSVNKGDSLITLNMTLDPKAYHLKGNDIVRVMPMLINGSDTLSMPPVRVAGRSAWYSEIRDGISTPLSLSRAGKGNPVEYSATLPYDSSIENSMIIMQTDTTSICNCNPPKSGQVPVIRIQENPPIDLNKFARFEYVAPVDSGDKVFNLSGRANIIFKVNKTDIDWTYFSNHAELDSIMKSVNAVKNNEYATVDTIFLTGYASPEGPYANNVRLAKGRTEEVLKYVQTHSGFPRSIFQAHPIPEDWDGLREWIINSDIPNRHAMVAFIDDPSIPIEKKNDMFRAKFPADYPFLLQNVYPLLRHTDYRIRYRIKKFYDVNEIEKVFQKNPSILSLNELYLLSNKYEQGTPKYNEVMMTAAAMHPESEVANINAAYSAISNGNYQLAELYLKRLKPSAETDYAWGVIYALQGQYDEAKAILKRAQEAGNPNAAALINAIEEATKPREAVTIL